MHLDHMLDKKPLPEFDQSSHPSRQQRRNQICIHLLAHEGQHLLAPFLLRPEVEHQDL